MSEFESKGDIVVCGAGLVGSLIGYILQKKGYTVTIYERYGDIRQIPSLGRSINLVLTGRGLRAINAIGGGLREEILALGVPVTGRVMHQMDSSTQYQPYGKDDSECNYSISRFELNKFLINKATSAGVKIYFGHALNESGTTFADGTVNNNGGDVGSILNFTVCDSATNADTRFVVQCNCPVIACDGAGSRARYSMRNDGLSDFTEQMLGADTGVTHGYKEMLFPKDSGLIQHGLHIWPRRTHMMMALANLDGSMTGTLYMDMTGEESFASITDAEKSDAFFKKYYPDAIELIGGIELATKQMLTNPSGILGTVRTTKWNHKGRVVLIGDASHAIVPFFGQGMNSGFEDCYDLLHVFADMNCKGGQAFPPVEESAYVLAPVEQPMSDSDAANWAAAFDQIHIDRKPNGDAIADLALGNFEEMRDKVADRCFLLQKRVENRVENAFESKFRSMYAMVVYGGGGNITYQNALALGKIQQQILRELIDDQVAELYALSETEWTDKLDEMAAKVSMDRAEELINSKLIPMQTELGIDLTTISH